MMARIGIQRFLLRDELRGGFGVVYSVKRGDES